MKKKRSKLQWLAWLLVAALMMTAGMPSTVSVRAEDDVAFAEIDLIPDEPHELGGGTGGLNFTNTVYHFMYTR